MRHRIAEQPHILAHFKPGDDPVTIALYDLSDNSVVGLDSSSMVEVATTGIFKWNTSNITTQPTALTEYLWVADNGAFLRYGKIVLGGYPESIDAKVSEAGMSEAALHSGLTNFTGKDDWKADLTTIDKTGYTLTVADKEDVAERVESHLLDEGDSQMLLNAIVAAIGNTNVDEVALVAAIRADLERTGGLSDQTLGVVNNLNNLSAAEIDTALSTAHGSGSWVGQSLTTQQAEALTRILDLLEADEEHSPTELIRRLKGTATVLQRKDVTGSSLTGTLTIVEQ